MAPPGQAAFSQTTSLLVRLPLMIVLGLAMASCRTTGDFGRPRPSYFHDHFVPAIRSSVGDFTGIENSSFPLTAAEVELRARSVTIIENEGPSAARYFDQAGADYGFDEGTYQEDRRVAHSTGTPDLAEERYPRPAHILLAAVTEDVNLLDAFAAVAREVYRTDKRRLKALRKGGDVPASYVLDTTGRVQENRAIVENIILALHNRIDDYEIELRRSILAFPYGEPAAVDNAIGRFSDRLLRFEGKIRSLTDPAGLKHYSDLLG